MGVKRFVDVRLHILFLSYLSFKDLKNTSHSGPILIKLYLFSDIHLIRGNPLIRITLVPCSLPPDTQEGVVMSIFLSRPLIIKAELWKTMELITASDLRCPAGLMLQS